jgi:hypothetical protein
MESKATAGLNLSATNETLQAYCPDLAEWPRSWQYEQCDYLPGQQLVELFKPFLLHLASLHLSGKTLRKHRDNLWLLGGEIIRDLQHDPRLRKCSMQQILTRAIDPDGGPLLSHSADESAQRAFDATCRKLSRFLRSRKDSS